jgi:hypothetical protein
MKKLTAIILFILVFFSFGLKTIKAEENLYEVKLVREIFLDG